MKRAHGVRGGLLVAPASDHPGRFAVGSLVDVDGGPADLEVVASQPHPHGVIVYFSGITDRGAAESLRRRRLTIAPQDRRRLDDDEYWPDELVGLPVTTPGGVRLGTVSDVVVGGSQDRLVVTTEQGEEVEVPFVSALVPEVGPRSVVVDPPEGLFPVR